MKRITVREDIFILVDNFYEKIREDVILGDIFNSHIPEDRWPSHLQKLTDFWERILLNGRNFRGNPTQKHIDVDNNLNNSVSQEHFGRWLSLWFQTIDELYDCELAITAKEASRKMAHAQFMMIYNNRKK